MSSTERLCGGHVVVSNSTGYKIKTMSSTPVELYANNNIQVSVTENNSTFVRNIIAPNIQLQLESVVKTNGGTKQLSPSSPHYQILTGNTGGFVVYLPNVTLLTIGTAFRIINTGTGGNAEVHTYTNAKVGTDLGATTGRTYVCLNTTVNDASSWTNDG